jgi:hypothetical protein
MTFEEMQQILEQMLGVQRDLQEGQIRNQQSIAELTQNVNRLVGYGIDHETDLDVMRSELNSLKARIDRLEERSN